MTNGFRETFLFITVSVTINNNYVFVHLPTLIHCCILFDIYLIYSSIIILTPTIIHIIVSNDYNNYSDMVYKYNIMSCPHIYFFVPTTSSLFK